ncbi:DUF2142 domain-containing protein [Oerskovia jenensis]|uniref:DUF2142 domain-containing protein n=1 Tax=Oerskovia jenensis TaxID=162169 RepID=A0ABS2LIX1_9CELL|nr:DUF2142 domain-containing protein [Oerskovia jenensis]MBM7480368.1 hypothetical protein [Oerskovia jenensis]
MSSLSATLRRRRGLVGDGRMSPRKAFWSSFLAFFVISGLWAVNNPLMASVDEPAHMIKAASVVLGSEDVSTDGGVTGIGLVEIPLLYNTIATFANCLAFQPEATASCQPEITGDIEQIATIPTSAVNYNPLYYAVVGLPALIPDDGGEYTAYLMRLINALVSSAVLALAVRTIAEMPRRRWMALGLLLPLTPTFINLTGSINPQSFEVTGSVLLWVTLLALLRAPDPGVLARRATRLVIATTLVAHARGLGPFFVVLIVLLCVGTSPWKNLVALVRQRSAQIAIVLCVLSCALATAWILFGNALPDRAVGSGISDRDTFLHSAGNTSYYLNQLVAALGWLDVAFPTWFYMVYAALVGLMMFLGWAAGSWRDRLGIVVVSALVLTLPIVIQVAQAPTIGWFWQGRYIFPVAIGLTFLCALAIERRPRALDERMTRNLVTTTAVVLVGLQVAALVFNLHRYINGGNGGWFKLDAESWLPPVNLVVLLITYAAAWVAFAVIALRAATPREARPADEVVSSPTTSDLPPEGAPLVQSADPRTAPGGS